MVISSWIKSRLARYAAFVSVVGVISMGISIISSTCASVSRICSYPRTFSCGSFPSVISSLHLPSFSIVSSILLVAFSTVQRAILFVWGGGVNVFVLKCLFFFFGLFVIITCMVVCLIALFTRPSPSSVYVVMFHYILRIIFLIIDVLMFY